MMPPWFVEMLQDNGGPGRRSVSGSGYAFRRWSDDPVGKNSPGMRGMSGSSIKGGRSHGKTERESRRHHRRQQRHRSGDGKAFRRRGAYVFITGRRQAELDRPSNRSARMSPPCRATSPTWPTLTGCTRRSSRERPDRRPVRQRRRRRIRPRARSRGALRQGLQHQRQGRALHGAESAAAVQPRRLHHPDGLGRRRQGHSRRQRLQRHEGGGSLLRAIHVTERSPEG